MLVTASGSDQLESTPALGQAEPSLTQRPAHRRRRAGKAGRAGRGGGPFPSLGPTALSGSWARLLDAPAADTAAQGSGVGRRFWLPFAHRHAHTHTAHAHANTGVQLAGGPAGRAAHLAPAARNARTNPLRSPLLPLLLLGPAPRPLPGTPPQAVLASWSCECQRCRRSGAPAACSPRSRMQTLVLL